MEKEKEKTKRVLKVYSDFKGEYILIRNNHLIKSGFNAGDFFNINFGENQIILNKISDTV